MQDRSLSRRALPAPSPHHGAMDSPIEQPAPRTTGTPTASMCQPALPLNRRHSRPSLAAKSAPMSWQSFGKTVETTRSGRLTCTSTAHGNILRKGPRSELLLACHPKLRRRSTERIQIHQPHNLLALVQCRSRGTSVPLALRVGQHGVAPAC